MVRALMTMTLIGCTGTEPTGTSTTTVPEPDPYVTDTFPQTLITPVDVVWVVDPGWDEGLQALDDALMDEAFTLYLLADPSWRLGILDASAGGTDFGMVAAVLETWPRLNPFAALPPKGRLEPRYREAVYTAFDLRVAEGENEDFLRSDAHLYLVYFGVQEDATSDKDLTLEAYESWLADLRPSDSKRISIITDSGAVPYWEQQLYGDGNLFPVGSFRDAILATFLDSMGQRKTFTLTLPVLEPPTVATVIFRNQRTDYAIDRDYSYDPLTNAITFFEVLPPPESTVEVRYIPSVQVETGTVGTPTGTTNTGTATSP
jgi:hypothetical protein